MSLVTGELQMKATEIPSQNDYHQATSQKILTRMQRKKKPYSFLVGGQTSMVTMEINMGVLYDPV